MGGYALNDLALPGKIPVQALGRWEAPINIAVKNMMHRGLDQDGNAGVVFERMAQVLLRCGMAQGDEEQQRIASRRRATARDLLNRALPLIDATTKSGEADLTHISSMITMELQVLDAQDSLYRKALGAPVPAMSALP